MKVSYAIAVGFFLGVLGVTGQLSLLWLHPPQAAVFRGLLTFCIVMLVGIWAGSSGKRDALTAAAISGLISGGMITSVGMCLALRNTDLVGRNPFSTVESALSFVSSVMIATVISSWLLAGIEVLVALPISQALRLEGKHP